MCVCISDEFILESSEDAQPIAVGANKVAEKAKKCDRCWYYSESVGMASADQVCDSIRLE